MMRYLLSVFFFLLPLYAFANYRIVPQTGHGNEPVITKWHPQSQTVISASKSGQIIITLPSEKTILHRFKVTRDKIIDIQLCDSSRDMAIVTSNGIQYRITVWEWDKEIEKYSITIQSPPTFLAWSSGGTYLVSGWINIPSIIIFDGKSGEVLPYMSRLPSIYNEGYIGSNETILMTYSSTGELRYWDIQSSELKFISETLSGLDDLTVLQIDDKSSMIARKADSLFLINRQSGHLMDRLQIKGFRDFSIDQSDGSLSLIMEDSTLRQYQVHNNTFAEANPPVRIENQFNPVKIVRTDGNNYVFGEFGEMFLIRKGDIVPIVKNTIWKPGALVFVNDNLYLAGQGKIFRITSPFFDTKSSGDTEELTDYSIAWIDLESPTIPVGMLALQDERLLIWGKDISIIDFDQPDHKQMIPAPNLLENIKPMDESKILMIAHNSTLTVMDIMTGQPVNHFPILGINDAEYISAENSILIGKSSEDTFTSSLGKINLKTGEMVPVPDDRFVVYRITASPDSIYTLGIAKDKTGKKTTIIKAHKIGQRNNSSVLMQVEGEDMQAIITDSKTDKNTVYTTLKDRLRRIKGSDTSELEWAERIVQLEEHNTILYGIDDDGALILWTTKDDSEQPILSITFFQDHSWLARIPGTDLIWASDNIQNNINLYKDDVRVNTDVLQRLDP